MEGRQAEEVVLCNTGGFDMGFDNCVDIKNDTVRSYYEKRRNKYDEMSKLWN